MTSSALHLTLLAEKRPGYFTLTNGTDSYLVEFHPETLTDLLRRLRPVLVGGSDPSRQLAPPELLREFGTRLWQALLPDSTPAAVRDTVIRELREGITPVLLSLPASLVALPWELLCDPALSDDAGFLVCQRPLARLTAGSTSLPPLALPLRVLLLISSPPGLTAYHRVDVESERATVESATRAFREAGLLHLQIEDIVTPRRAQQALLRFKPHIVHYIGHGRFGDEAGGSLIWEDDQGNPFAFPDSRLAELLRPRGLRAVVLHACQTASSDLRTDLRGVAGALLDAGIPAVVAQQANFTYESSQRGSEMFYTALISGLGLAEAVFELRQALAQADRPDWAVPTLQAEEGGLMPLLDAAAVSGPVDPMLTRHGAAADLPAPSGVFVGRQRELRALRTLLESAPGTGPALALISGPGGVGKSTLTAQAVTRYGGTYKAALTLSCADYQGLELFLQRMGEFLKRQGAAGLLEQTLPDPKLSTATKIEAAIEAFNAAGPFLLIVDNLESVQQEDRTLADPELLYLLQKLLTNLQGGRVLITGRYAVEGLLPDGKFAANLLRLDLDDLSGREIEQLLARHPALARLGDVVRAELVREFGGLPYVYDLLSSQAAGLSLEDVIHDVQGRITEERKQRTAAEWEDVRRRAVEFAALEATITRLPEPSRTLLKRLSIFRRTFPLKALEQGLGATREEWQSLLDWALLRYDPIEGDYRLHSLTARYSGDLLDVADRQATQVQIAEWYLRYGREESHDLAEYLEAHHLLRAAGKGERAGDLAINLGEVLNRLGLYKLWRQLCTLTITDTHTTQEGLTAQALHQLGIIAYSQGDYAEARRLYGESLAIKERLGDQGGRAITLHQLGMIAQDQGDYAEARRLYGEVLSIFERLGDQGGRANTLHQLGMIAQHQGDYPEARRLYGESLAIKERLGNQAGRANTLHQLGLLARQQKDYQAALSYTLQALDIFERLRSPYRSLALRTLAQLRAEVGEATFTGLWQQTSGGRPLPDLTGDADASPDEDADQDENGTGMSLAELPQYVATVITQGTMPQRQHLAEQLSEVQAGLPPDEAVLAPLLACLVAALRGETPDTSSLEEPLTSLWQQFQDELKSQNRQQDQ